MRAPPRVFDERDQLCEGWRRLGKPRGDDRKRLRNDVDNFGSDECRCGRNEERQDWFKDDRRSVDSDSRRKRRKEHKTNAEENDNPTSGHRRPNNRILGEGR